jgi:hypothetical protein
MKTSDVCNGALGYVQKLAATALVLQQTVDSQAEKIALLEEMLSGFARPSAIVPVAEVPVRQVTGVALEEEHE